MNKRLLIMMLAVVLPVCSAESSLVSPLLTYPADGKSSGTVTFIKSSGSSDTILLPVEGAGDIIQIIAKERSNNNEVVYFRSTGRPGSVIFRTSNGLKLQLEFYRTGPDLDNDGFPDAVELDSDNDRSAFINWFVRVAESQYLKKNYSWNAAQRDCAGLIRFAYKEALKKHDCKWLRKSGIVLDKNIPDVKKYNFPDMPVIKNRLFKIQKGPADKPDTFGHYADAATLMNLNSTFISKDMKDAEKGDILFFRDDKNVRFPYHSMIVSGHDGGEIFLIYHTGAKNDIVKRITLSYLYKSSLFRPEKWNKNFLGIFRFLILE